MKRALQQLVQSKPLKKPGSQLRELKLIVVSHEYKEAACAGDLFDLLAPRWNWKECELLEFLIEASDCEAAVKKLQEFLERRNNAAPHVVLHTNQAAKAITKPVHEAILMQPRAKPLAEATAEHEEEQELTIVAKLDKNTLTLKEYDQTTSVLSRAYDFGRYLLCLDSITDGCIAIQWRVSVSLASELQHKIIGAEDFQALARQNIIEIKFGSNIYLNVATRDYWDRKQPQVRNYSDITL